MVVRMQKDRGFKVRDLRNKQFFVVDDVYLNGYARLLGAIASVVYFSLCRHADKDQSCFPSQKFIAEEFNIGQRTVRDKLRLLEECNIIKTAREKDNKGRWLNNTYILVDKSDWLSKEEVAKKLGVSDTEDQRQPLPVDCPEANDDTIQRQPLPHKDTHIKETHNNDINIVTEAGFGNGDVSTLIAYLKETLQLPMLDGSEKTNRRYCWLALKKFGGADKVRLLIDAAAQDDFWSTRIASFQQLYYKGVQIISKTRGGAGGRPNIRFIDPA
jgi:hypothetical protein